MADHDTHDHTGIPGVGVGDATAHIADTADAHDASAISADTTGYDNSSATDVQGVLGDFDAAITAGGGGGGVTVQDEGTPLATTATTLNFTGSGVTASGSGATKTINITGGGSVSPTYLGYDTIGGTGEVGTAFRMVAKTFTPASDCTLLAVEVYTRESVDGLSVWAAALHDNNAGAIGTILASGIQPQIAYTNNSSFVNNNTVSVPRWISIPVTYKLTGGTVYWGGVFIVSQTNSVNMFYDGSGNDRRYDSGGGFLADGGRYSQTDTTRKYSIRFLTI